MRHLILPLLAVCTVAAGPAPQTGGAVAVRSPEQAAGQGLMSCVAHAMGARPITAANAAALEADGLRYAPNPPAFLARATQTSFGTAAFAQSPSSDGQVWVSGYDTGVCIVTAIGTPEASIVSRLNQLFAIPNSWKAEKIKQLPGGRWSAYRLKTPATDLTAQMVVHDIPAGSPVKGFVMVTIAPKSMVKN